MSLSTSRMQTFSFLIVKNPKSVRIVTFFRDAKIRRFFCLLSTRDRDELVDSLEHENSVLPLLADSCSPSWRRPLGETAHILKTSARISLTKQTTNGASRYRKTCFYLPLPSGESYSTCHCLSFSLLFCCSVRLLKKKKPPIGAYFGSILS